MIDKIPPNLIIGKIALSYKLITDKQFKEAVHILEIEKAGGKEIDFGDILLQKQLMNQKQLNFLKAAANFWELRQLDIKFGIIAIKKALISQDDINEALKFQAEEFQKKKIGRLIGDILCERGKIKEEDKNLILCEQNRIKVKNIELQEDNTLEHTNNKIDFELILSKEGSTKAFIKIKDEKIKTNINDVKQFLSENGIKHGIISDNLIEEFLKNATLSSEPFLVAEGTPPILSIDAKIQYFFETKYFKIGAIKEDGTIDFKNRGDIPYVKKGDLLAEKIPKIKGEYGTNIFGDYIPVQPPRDIKLRCGPGAQLSSDKIKAFAEVDGQPHASSDGRVYVYPELQINGDVGLKTGHINFDGNVVINGTIQEGFKVYAGNILVKEIYSGEVKASGDIVSYGGIINSKITTHGSLKAKYIQSSEINAYGDINVDKEIVDSEIITSGACNIPIGKIISSTIAAKKGIFAEDIGTGVSEPCKIKAGVDEHAKRLINDIKKTIAIKKETINLLKEKIYKIDLEQNEIHKQIADMVQIKDQNEQSKKSILSKLANLNPEYKVIYEKFKKILVSYEEKLNYLDDSINVLFEKSEQKNTETDDIKNELSLLEKEIENLNDDLEAVFEWSQKEKGISIIKVTGLIHDGTICWGQNTSSALRATYSDVNVREIKVQLDADGQQEWEIKVFTAK